MPCSHVSLTIACHSPQIFPCIDLRIHLSPVPWSDVRSTAHVILRDSEASCVGGKELGEGDMTEANRHADILFHQCKSLDGQGRKACQSAGCVYAGPAQFSVSVAHADLASDHSGIDVVAGMDPRTQKWRLCLVRANLDMSCRTT